LNFDICVFEHLSETLLEMLPFTFSFLVAPDFALFIDIID